MLELFEAATPEIYSTAMALVDIVCQRPLDTREALVKALEECIELGFRFTGDDLDMENDFAEVTPTECMQDKFPDELAGFPVALKLEIGKAYARHGIDSRGTVDVVASRSGMAVLTFFREDGTTFGPLELNYRMTSPDWIIEQERERVLREQKQMAARRVHVDPQAPYRHIPYMERPRVRGMIPDDYGRLPGENGYNTGYPLGQDPVSQMQAAKNQVHVNGGSDVQGQNGGVWPGSSPGTDQLGRLPGEPDYMMPFPTSHPTMPRKHGNNPQRSNPWGTPLEHEPWTGSTRGYMAGLTRSIVEARLAQQILGGSSNIYQYAVISDNYYSTLATIKFPHLATTLIRSLKL